MRLAVDANLLIYILEGNPVFGKVSADFIKQCQANSVEVVISELMYLEVLAADSMSEAGASKAKRWLDELSFTYKPVTQEVLLAAARLRRRYGMRTPDAIYVASAIQSKCTYFVTNDRVLLKKKVAGIKLLPLDSVKEASLFPRDINRLAP